MHSFLHQPWPWYVGGAIIGLIVPALLLLGNKHFGISAIFRHVCAACFPARLPFFKYNWRREAWNFFFVGGVIFGAFIAAWFMADPSPVKVHPDLLREISKYGITDHKHQLPTELFSWDSLLSWRGLIMLVGGGFLVGFGSRYAGGCTSGHSIMGLSNLQWPSLVATLMFMVGGFLMVNFLLPFILRL